MSTVDIIIVCLIAFPAVIGIFYGFLNITFSLLVWIVSLGLSVKLTPYFSPLLEAYIAVPLPRMIFAFVGLFIISLLIMNGIRFFIMKLLDRTHLTLTDRILGFFLGAGFGSLIIFMIIFLSGFTLFPQETWWNESRLIKPFERINIWTVHYLPESLQKYHSYERQQNEGE